MDLSLLYYSLQGLAGFIAFVTIWGWIPLDNWWVRGVEFPRIQIMVLGAIAWIGMLLFWSEWDWYAVVLVRMAVRSVGAILSLKYHFSVSAENDTALYQTVEKRSRESKR